MNRLAAIFAFCAGILTIVPAFGQTTYTWVGSIDSSWNKGNNLVPPRNSASPTDIIVLNGA